MLKARLGQAGPGWAGLGWPAGPGQPNAKQARWRPAKGSAKQVAWPAWLVWPSWLAQPSPTGRPGLAWPGLAWPNRNPESGSPQLPPLSPTLMETESR